jgi:hypothetical protein
LHDLVKEWKTTGPTYRVTYEIAVLETLRKRLRWQEI